MATFIPPVTGATSMAAPTRGLVDVSGHRTCLIARFSGAGLRAVAPCRAAARPVAIAGDFTGAAAAGGRFWFTELTPLPTPGTRAAFAALGARGGLLPRFFIGGTGISETAPVDLVAPGTPLTASGDVYVGATLGVCALSPGEWARILVEAMAGETGLDPWDAFRPLLEAGPSLYVLNHAGQVPADGEMNFEVDTGDGTVTGVALGANGDLQAATPLPLFDPGTRIRLATGAGGIPYHTAFDPGLRSPAAPDTPISDLWFSPAQFAGGRGTILCTDLDRWFGARPPGVTLARYRAGNRLVGLLDGEETLGQIRADIDTLLQSDIPADGQEYGAWLASWAFKNIRMRPDRAGEPAEPLFVELIKALDARARQLAGQNENLSVRLLATKLVNFEGNESALERRLMCVILLIWLFGEAAVAALLLRAVGKGVAWETGVALSGAGMLAVIAAHPAFVDIIEGAIDGSNEVMGLLEPQDASPHFALWSRYPARFSDNPVSSGNLAGMLDSLAHLKRLGVWHSKMQLFALPARTPGAAPDYVGYLGGVDINENRIDSWGHGWPAEYHDVHAKLTGPAVADLFQSYYERYVHEMAVQPGLAIAANTCPCDTPRDTDGGAKRLAAIPATGDDIVQIARTIYRPQPQNAAEGFWFAPQGEASAHDSILRAINSAREYIYIEDQFMAPPDQGLEQVDDQGEEILEALMGAANRCRALIMVFPEGTGDPQWRFGVERRNWLMSRLAQAWSNSPSEPDRRHFLPLIHARPLLDKTGHVAAFRRTILKEAIADGATFFSVVDGIRVPATPCWAWISGELVLVTKKELVTSDGTARLTVERGVRHNMDAWVRPHPKGAPVTFARFDDVFIHAKMMLVDDVYGSIGSVNMSRRSMYHDGEISAQVIPGQLRAAAANPVRDLRCRVWADHLGIPPDTALSALADPLDALALFRRSRAAGNTLVPFKLLDDLKPQGMSIETKDAIAWLGTIFGGIGQVGGDLVRRDIYSTIVDPTTALDPFFASNPFPGFDI